MTGDSLKTRLLKTLDAARTREAALLALCDDSPPSHVDRWTAKDNVAHLSAWREHAARTLDAVRRGVPVDGPVDAKDIDGRNAAIYEAHRHDSAATVRVAARESYAALVDALNACSDDDLLRDRPENGGPVWQVVPGNGHAHVAQHLSYWAAENDDQAGAEDAARWAYALDTDLFPEHQAIADYNFGCFYARNGRADEALPLLGAALRSRPEMRSFALDDTDIEPIRDDPRVQSLLGP